MALHRFSTVLSLGVSPAVSYDLIDLAAAKAELALPTTDTKWDAFLTQAITQESIAVSNYCNRVFVVEEIQDEYLFDGAWDALQRGIALRTSRYPIVAISSLTQDGGSLTADTDYRIANGNSLVRMQSGGIGSWGSSPVTIQYTAGYESIPADVQKAVLRLVTSRFWAKGRDAMLMERSQGNQGTERFWVGRSPGQSGSMPPEVAGLLESYVIPVVV